MNWSNFCIEDILEILDLSEKLEILDCSAIELKNFVTYFYAKSPTNPDSAKGNSKKANYSITLIPHTSYIIYTLIRHLCEFGAFFFLLLYHKCTWFITVCHCFHGIDYIYSCTIYYLWIRCLRLLNHYCIEYRGSTFPAMLYMYIYYLLIICSKISSAMLLWIRFRTKPKKNNNNHNWSKKRKKESNN